ncbi:hypothetical protein [Yersinia phage fHe-Yen9-04]|uniref:Uncharacterized protein n=1 Tax=Yersinia phage fHe-Yen9-04 TaxID=2052742 RepID=A0A2C9CXQ7_9CAUD|nr:hypothetical protein FDJ41_gp346 [Yersinia phage fHe-Yen9-04]SOK58623.1 hypothetical protein [Yersinia phage fHe-Yen9-04]VUE36392.1 hypothetical protein [Yersinia phage fHe-Yen9-04]
MIITKSVIQVLVDIAGINSIQILKDTLQAAVGNVSIVSYSVSPSKAILYVEAQPTEGMVTFDLAVKGDGYSLIHVVESIVTDNPNYTEGSVAEVFAENKTDEPLSATVIIFDRDPKIDNILTKEFKLSNISTYDGLVSISVDDGLILIEKQCNVVIDYSTYNKETGTVRFQQTSRSEDPALHITRYTEEELEDLNRRIEESKKRKKVIVDDYIINKKRVQLSNIEVVNGNVMIFDKDNKIILLQDEYNLDYDRDSFNTDDGTVVIIRTDIKLNHLLDTGLNAQIDQAVAYDKELYRINGTKLIEGIINAFDDIEHDNYTYTSIEDETNISNIQKMKELLIKISEDEDITTMSQSVQYHYNDELHCLSENSEVDTEELTLTQEELRELTKVQRSNEVIEVENAVISFDAFDSYASKHHVIGWDLATPSTLSIKFIEGITPESTIRKFHDMMDNLDTGWINSYQMNKLKSVEESTKFLADLRNMIIDEKDIADEFISRVNKHNIFVRDSISKIRASLLDMENDFERSLKNEVNLSIDWDKLTAYAAKKERTEHRVKGVRIISGNDGVTSNVVRVNSEFENGDFFIPIHLLTDEIRSKYVIESYPQYIEDVPDYAFHEVHLNGHFILIENTEL